ncbi:GNAT family N-acetyltransferase [Planococcus sp. 1R117A]|uniref:GNAT family N-acetyltransferase n=1 Tax=Planococcus sp. 1R117A TaxID=3447020 RepID=UPI003EDC8877
MKIEILQPTIEQRNVLQNLLELYQYDFSEFETEDVNEEGVYGYKYLDYYWAVPGHFPFLIKVNGNLAGFALVREINSADLQCDSYFKISEFFILKKYRKEGIGKQAAFYLFDLFPGEWEVAELEANLPAQKFWRKVISAYTNNNYSEIRKDNWHGPIQRFTSALNFSPFGAAYFPKLETDIVETRF